MSGDDRLSRDLPRAATTAKPPTTVEVPTGTRSALAAVERLWMICAGVSVLALVAAGVLTAIAPDQVNWVVWLRGTVLTVASAVFVVVTRAAARGSRRAFTRMRWFSLVAPFWIIVILIAPDAGYPLWMKAEQAVAGALIVAIAVILNRRSVRRSFDKPERGRA